jgi:nucleoside-diphosphate-sugar epimerase
MRVLVTGSSGFIGDEICQQLFLAGHEIVGLQRHSNIRELHYVSQTVLADISDNESIKRISKEIPPCDAIVHSAACLSSEYLDIINVNCLGLQNIIWLASQWVCSHFVFMSSIPVVGVPRVFPIDENHPLEPKSIYHISKLFGEKSVNLLSMKGVNAISLRVPAPVGANMPNNRFLSVLVDRAMKNEVIELSGKGTRQQNYIDVRDIAQATFLSLEKQISGVFNIGSANCISNLDLARLSIELCQSKSDIIFNASIDPEDGYIWDVSIDKAKKKLCFDPQFSIDAVINLLINKKRKMSI